MYICAHAYIFYRYNDIAQFGLTVTEKDGSNTASSSQKEPSTSQNATPVDKPTDLGRYCHVLWMHVILLVVSVAHLVTIIFIFAGS